MKNDNKNLSKEHRFILKRMLDSRYKENYPKKDILKQNIPKEQEEQEEKNSLEYRKKEELPKQEQAKTHRDRAKNASRTQMFKWVTKITKCYLSFVAFFLSSCFFIHIFGFKINSFTSILITLLTTTTINIVALSFALTKSLFPNDLKEIQ
jgi:hypothetical protein